jgi:hypothetical protein
MWLGSHPLKKPLFMSGFLLFWLLPIYLCFSSSLWLEIVFSRFAGLVFLDSLSNMNRTPLVFMEL